MPFNGIGSSAKNATNGIKAFNKAGAIAALGGGVIAGTTMEGEGKTTDVLSAMALGAAAGAVQFGALGAGNWCCCCWVNTIGFCLFKLASNKKKI